VSTNGQQVTITVADLPKPKIITVVYGSTSGGPGGKAVPPTASNPAAVFVVESDPLGTDLQPIAAPPAVNLQPGAITALHFGNAAFAFQTTLDAGPFTVVAKGRVRESEPRRDGADNRSNVDIGRGHVLGAPHAFLRSHGERHDGGRDAHRAVLLPRHRGRESDRHGGRTGPVVDGASQQQSVNPGPEGLIELSAADATVTVDEYARITIDVTDIYGNPTALSSNRSLSLTSTATSAASPEPVSPELASGEFFLPGDHSTPISVLDMTAGMQSAEVDFRSTNANGGNPHLIVILDDDPPPLSGSVNVTVLPGR